MLKFLNNGQREIAKIHFHINSPLTFKVKPINGDPEHIITVTRFVDVFEAISDISTRWGKRGKAVIVTHILN
jgi:hypothetical protein